MKVAFISCVKGKRAGRHRARDLYDSPLFRLAWEHARRRFDRVYILSARYGLLHPDRRIASYEMTLKGLPVQVRRRWARRVAAQIRTHIPRSAELHFFCGRRYREFLTTELTDRKIHVPLARLGLGRQLQWYRRKAST